MAATKETAGAAPVSEELAGVESSTDAFELLRAQHRTMEALFDDVERAADAHERHGRYRELADLLLMHGLIEERHFYPAVRRDETEALVMASLEGHGSMRQLIEEMLTLPIADTLSFEAKLSTLRGIVLHHVHEEEEGELMPLAARFLDEDLRQALGQEMIATMVDFEAEREGDATASQAEASL